MTTTMKLVTRPYALRRTQPAVLREVRDAYKQLGAKLSDESVAKLTEEGFTTENIPPIKVKVTVKVGMWEIVISYNKRTKAGKILNWVDKGTGMQGGFSDQPYVIRPKKAKALHFSTPFLPLSKAKSGLPPTSSLWPEGEHFVPEVRHPGIDPRHFFDDIITFYQSRQSGSFRNVTEAAVKRAVRKDKSVKSNG